MTYSLTKIEKNINMCKFLSKKIHILYIFSYFSIRNEKERMYVYFIRSRLSFAVLHRAFRAHFCERPHLIHPLYLPRDHQEKTERTPLFLRHLYRTIIGGYTVDIR